MGDLCKKEGLFRAEKAGSRQELDEATWKHKVSGASEIIIPSLWLGPLCLVNCRCLEVSGASQGGHDATSKN